jgi:glycosyltransferase involved in cell wall biosynthesis
MCGYKNVSLMARGVDTAQFNTTNRSEDLRKSWGAKHDDLVLIHVGRLAKEKNIHLVLTAFKAIQQANPNAKLVFVGDGPLRDELAQLCPQAIFSGSKQGKQLAEHYASADLFLFPSITETFGNVVPEALASGLCVVAYDYAAAGYIIKHRVNGLLAPFNQSKDFINTALDAAHNLQIRNQCRAQSAASIANIRWDSVIDNLEKLLYVTANGLKHSNQQKKKRAKRRAMRSALHKMLNPMKL